MSIAVGNTFAHPDEVNDVTRGSAGGALEGPLDRVKPSHLPQADRIAQASRNQGRHLVTPLQPTDLVATLNSVTSTHLCETVGWE